MSSARGHTAMGLVDELCVAGGISYALPMARRVSVWFHVRETGSLCYIEAAAYRNGSVSNLRAGMNWQGVHKGRH